MIFSGLTAAGHGKFGELCGGSIIKAEIATNGGLPPVLLEKPATTNLPPGKLH
jgi:hypothetical protein